MNHFHEYQIVNFSLVFQHKVQTTMRRTIKHLPRLKLLCLLSVLISQVGLSQQVTLFGKVTDNNRQPVPFASVYVDATSFGTSTDVNGMYTLSVPASKQQIELIASLVGYETRKTTVYLRNSNGVETNITLNGIVLDEVVVQAKTDRFWRKKWNIFRNGLLGDVSTTRNYEFLNRENINLTYDESDKFVFATSKEPFTIVNETLGYILRVDLEYFKSNGIFTEFSVYTYFQENLNNNPSIRKRQIENRKKAYYSTFRHFLVSLKDGKLAENKFEVYKINKMNQVFLGRTSLLKETSEGRLIPAKEEEIYAYDSTKNVHYLHADKSLLVFNKNFASYQGNPFSDYYYEFSKIDLPNFILQFNENGYILRPNGLLLSYHWGKEGLGSQLPENYTPDGIEDKERNNPTEKALVNREDLNKNTPLSEINLAPILAKQITLDSLVFETPTLLERTVTFNRIENENTKPDNFYEPDIRYQLSPRDANQPIWEILKRIPGLRVMLDNLTGEYNLLVQGSNSSLLSDAEIDKTPNLVINKRVYRTRQEVMDQLAAVDTRQVREIGLIKYGGGAIFGATGGYGTIVILMNNFENEH